jgi:hypothetical protein
LYCSVGKAEQRTEKLVELETAQKMKTKISITASETNNNNVKVKRQASCWKTRVIAAGAAHGWDCAALWRKQLNDHDMGQVLQEVEAGRCPEWRDIANRSPIYRSDLAQWKYQEVRDGVLERYWNQLMEETRQPK